MLSALALALAAAPQDGEASRPDIVLILADDLGWSDISPYGGEIRTPNLERLAEEGLLYRQFYNAARCCPSRASLLTGLYPHQAGVGHMVDDKGWPAYRGDLAPEAATLAEVLRAAGYATAMAGKWHVTRGTGYWTGRPEDDFRTTWPRARGFERFYGTIHGGGSYYAPRTLVRDDTPLPPPGPGEDFYYTDRIAGAAAAFVEEHARRRPQDPLFLYVAFTAPHWPLQAPAEDVARYRGAYDGGFAAVREARRRRQAERGLLPEGLVPAPFPIPWERAPHPEWQSRAMEVYAAMVERMDRGIGHILGSLERTGRAENTLVLFLSDNGACAEGGRAWGRQGVGNSLTRPKFTRDGRLIRFGAQATVMPGPEDVWQEYGEPWAHVSNTPFRLYKHFVHEGGIRSPLLVRWPAGIPEAGAVRDQVGHLVDLMPTLAAVAGAGPLSERAGRPCPPWEGRSLLPSFRGAAPEERTLFWEHEGNAAVRQGSWKLVRRHRGGGAWELYELRRDPTEMADLAAAEPERVQAMRALWEDWAQRVGVRPWPVQPPEEDGR